MKSSWWVKSEVPAQSQQPQQTDKIEEQLKNEIIQVQEETVQQQEPTISVEELQNKLATLQEKMEVLESQNKDISYEKEKIQQELQQKQQELDSIQQNQIERSQNDAQSEQDTKTSTEYSDQIQILENSSQEQQKQIQHLQSEKQEMQSEILQLQQTIDSLNQFISNLKHEQHIQRPPDDRNKDSEFTKIEVENDKNEENSTNSTQIKELEEQIEQLKQQQENDAKIKLEQVNQIAHLVENEKSLKNQIQILKNSQNPQNTGEDLQNIDIEVKLETFIIPLYQLEKEINRLNEEMKGQMNQDQDIYQQSDNLFTKMKHFLKQQVQQAQPTCLKILDKMSQDLAQIEKTIQITEEHITEKQIKDIAIVPLLKKTEEIKQQQYQVEQVLLILEQ